MRLYIDSSALVKLVQRETESEALRAFLRRHRHDGLVTSVLSRVEVVRAVSPGGSGAVTQARRLLSRLDQVQLGMELLDRAATLSPTIALRTLDAIHLAAAQLVQDELRAVLTYDRRMADAAAGLGLPVAMPA